MPSTRAPTAGGGGEGTTHVDLYDKDEYVTPAVAELTDFFGKHL